MNPKFRKSSADYGFLVDQLDILESQLESDGKLSPGDFDLLNKKAQGIYSHPGLSNAQRSNIDVKMASYSSKKKSSQVKDAGDISKINQEFNNNMTKVKMAAANNPTEFLKAQSDFLRVKERKISDAIATAEGAGDDASNLYSEWAFANKDLADSLQALDDIEKGNKNTSYGAYVVTNSKGEVVDIKIGRTGTVSGYQPTNAIYGGLPLYGKTNRKNDIGENIFMIGNKEFKEGSEFITSESGMGQTKRLVYGGQRSPYGGQVIGAGTIEINPEEVVPQDYIPDGGWARGQKGFLYQKTANGFTKVVNADPTKRGINESEILNIPRELEGSITGSVFETVDDSIPAPLPTPITAEPNPSQATTTATTTPGVLGAGRGKTGGPTESSPKTGMGLAASTYEKAKGFLGRLFAR